MLRVYAECMCTDWYASFSRGAAHTLTHTFTHTESLCNPRECANWGAPTADVYVMWWNPPFSFRFRWNNVRPNLCTFTKTHTDTHHFAHGSTSEARRRREGLPKIAHAQSKSKTVHTRAKWAQTKNMSFHTGPREAVATFQTHTHTQTYAEL